MAGAEILGPPADGWERARRHARRASAAIAALLFLLAFGLLSPAPAAAQTAVGASRILVMPFETGDRDPRLLWLGEASAVLIGDNLRGYGFPALTRDERTRAFKDLNLPSDASLSEASVIRVGQIVSASDIILGTLRLAGDELTVDARRIRLDTGRIQQQVKERGSLRDLFELHDRVTRTLMGGAAASIPSQAGLAPPLAAFEQYVKGLVAEQADTQIKFQQAALAGFPGYDRPRLALWEVYTEQGDHAKALAAVQGVPSTSRLSRRARFLAGLSQIQVKKYDEAFALFKALADEQPLPAVLNNLGVVQLRRGATPQTGKATYFFTKASEADPDESNYFFNLGYAYWLDKDLQAAIYWLREAVRRNPADGDAHFVLGAALLAAGSQTEAARENELARQLSSRYEEWSKRQAGSGEPVPRGIERLSRDLESVKGQRLDAALLNSAQREQRELATFHLQRGRRLYEQEQNREALAELRKAVYLSPYEAEPHLLIGRIYLRTGRPREAVDALHIALWSQETGEARLALADALLQLGDRAQARTEAQRALQLSPGSADAKSLLSKIDEPPRKE
jgi:tetratricopeptide (TPR) repeat protein